MVKEILKTNNIDELVKFSKWMCRTLHGTYLMKQTPQKLGTTQV